MSGLPITAFVTGATGCIGSALTERLSCAGARVIAVVREEGRAGHLLNLPGVEIVEGDLGARGRLTEAMRGSEVVFHLAAQVHTDARESEFRRINVEGTRAVLEAATRNRVASFVFFSTVAVYPESDEVFDEQHAPAPATPYGASKLAAERLVLGRAACSGMKATVLRLPVVYGRRDRGHVGKLIEAIARGRFFLIGRGANSKSMVSVENAVDAALLVASDERARGQVYIVCDERGYTLAEIAETIAEVLGRRRKFRRLPVGPALWLGRGADALSALTGLSFPVSAERVRKLASNTRYSAAKIRRELGFTPRVSLRTGLAEIVRGDRASESSAGHERRIEHGLNGCDR
jgi:UDP-glucose 4-epimerase